MSEMDLMYSPDVEAFFGILLLVFAAFSIWSIIRYVLVSLSIFSISKRRGVSGYELAWIPGIRVWAIGGIADKHDSQNGSDHKWRYILITLGVIVVALFFAFFAIYTYEMLGFASALNFDGNIANTAVLPEGFIPIFSSYLILIPMAILTSCITVCENICLYKLYESCKPKKPVKSLLISLLVPFAYPFVLLSCRKHDSILNPTCETASLEQNSTEENDL